MLPCCSCNGRNAICRRCVCVRAGRPCVSCLPMKLDNCMNLLGSRATSWPELHAKKNVFSNGSASNLSSHVSLSLEICIEVYSC